MAPEKPRQKRFTRRSRTGCRTCRARHVKCDEAPGACGNCTSAGWKCDGYDANRLKCKAKTDQQIGIVIPSLSLQLLAKGALGNSSDERRAFVFFQESTVPNMADFFDSCLWNNVVLPMSHTEPAVVHAVIAVSTLHEDLEIRGTPLSREDLGNKRHRFALEQYGQALSALNKRRNIQDPELREVVLTCCLLFVVFELLRGRYDPALLHLQNGISIIQDSNDSERLYDSHDIKKYLAEAMARLDIQALFFGAKTPSIEFSAADGAIASENHLHNFHTLCEARREFDRLSHRTFSFARAAKSLSGRKSCLDSRLLDLQVQQTELRFQLAKYLGRLNRSKTLLQSGKDRERRGFDLIRLQHMTLSVLLETCLDDDEVLNSDAHLNACEEILDLSEQIVYNVMEECGLDTKSLPTLSLDTGIIPSLLYVCSKCPKAAVRQKALKLLNSWPHREGLWDSNLVAIFARQLLAIETEAETRRLSAAGAVPTSINTDYISDLSRVQDAFMSVAEDQTHAVITYTFKDSEQEGARMERVVILDEHI